MMFDMHFHTYYSDGNSKVRTVVKKANRLGFGVAITDHMIFGLHLNSQGKIILYPCN